VSARTLTAEREDLIDTLAKHRHFLRHTTRGLTDEQAAKRTTVSELCLGGLIKHVALVERQWVRFIVEGPSVMEFDPAAVETWSDNFKMTDGETLEGLLAHYEQVAAETDDLLASLPDLDNAQELPEAPWRPAGIRWSARRVFLHLIAEISQHAGHADILREALDGSKSMG